MYEANSWEHGAHIAATTGSETTAAAVGAIGVVRRDLMAMLPFCGYNMADYFSHWLAVGKNAGTKAPKIFGLNWFRKNEAGKFVWPGFGENTRVLKWIVERVEGKARATETPIGAMPAYEDMDWTELDYTPAQFAEATTISADQWRKEVASWADFFARFGGPAPKEFKVIADGLLGQFLTPSAANKSPSAPGQSL